MALSCVASLTVAAQNSARNSPSWSGILVPSSCNADEAFFESPECNKIVAGAKLSLYDDTSRVMYDLRPQDKIAFQHLQLALEQSDPIACPGTRVTLGAELRPPPDVHVYAPGPLGDEPVKLVIEAIPQMELKPADYPAAKILYLPAIKESVPVFERTFRITEDAKVNSGSEFLGSWGRRGKSSPYPENLSIRLATKPTAIGQHLSPSNGNYKYFPCIAPGPRRTFGTSSAV